MIVYDPNHCNLNRKVYSICARQSCFVLETHSLYRDIIYLICKVCNIRFHVNFHQYCNILYYNSASALYLHFLLIKFEEFFFLINCNLCFIASIHKYWSFFSLIKIPELLGIQFHRKNVVRLQNTLQTKDGSNKRYFNYNITVIILLYYLYYSITIIECIILFSS